MTMTKIDPNAPDPEPAVLARDLAREIVRAFAAVSESLAAHPPRAGTPPDEVAGGLQDWIAGELALFAIVFREGLDETIFEVGEAVDNLGLGCMLDPERVTAFGAWR